MKNVLRNFDAETFNRRFPVGSHFRYYPTMGIPDSIDVITTSTAWTLGHGAAVVKVAGRAGGVSVSHLEPLEVSSCQP